MPNLRIIHTNVADSSTLSANTTSGALVAANMLTDYKSVVHRTTGTSAVYTMTWAANQRVSGVALPATNLTSAATVRVQLYSDTAGTTQIADSGTINACPSSQLGLHGWPAINANAFSFGGASKVAVWFAALHTTVRRCVITVTDSANPAGYIDCSRLVAGEYWEADYNASYGATVSTRDLTTSQRSASGDQLTVRGAVYETMRFDLAMVTESKRAELAKIVRSVASFRNIFISLLPGNAAATAEQDHMIFGKRAAADMAFDFFNSFSTQFEVEGW